MGSNLVACEAGLVLPANYMACAVVQVQRPLEGVHGASSQVCLKALNGDGFAECRAATATAG